MKRDVYLTEYENMSFKERLYIVRKNDWKTGWDNYKIHNPLDWSPRKLWRAWIKLVVLCIWPIVYWPLVLLDAKRLKTRYINEKDKTWFHSDRDTLS
ncbi:putative TMhelix containing protein [Vibrio phage 382E49-1]|nr:putative TMhelix containing protein [Vibrio phage 382E49-1]